MAARGLTVLECDVIKDVLLFPSGAVAQLGARLDGIEEVAGSNPAGSTNSAVPFCVDLRSKKF